MTYASMRGMTHGRIPPGWRVVHYDWPCGRMTLERIRRFFKGRYRVVTGEQLYHGWPHN